jgi:hypothetical protein
MTTPRRALGKRKKTLSASEKRALFDKVARSVLAEREAIERMGPPRKWHFMINKIEFGRPGKTLLRGTVEAKTRQEAQLLVLERQKALNVPLRETTSSIGDFGR